MPDALRALVRHRAQGLCEYCLLHEQDLLHGFHVDHVISEKHSGPTQDHNLAWACPFCNRAKGSDIAGYVDGNLVRLYNPRIDRWSEHFRLDGARMAALSAIGRVTLPLLGLNDAYRLAMRELLLEAGLFPSAAAKRMLRR